MPSDSNDTTQETQSGPSRRGVLKSGAILAGGGLIGLPALTGSAAASGCAFTPGYWKNHPEAWLPKEEDVGFKPHIHFDSDQLESGPTAQKAYYFDSNGFPSAMEILNMPTRGDKSIIMAKHFIAAILNGRNDTKDWCIRGLDGPDGSDPEYDEDSDWRALAREFFDANPVGSGARSWRVNGYHYEEVKDHLEAYNEGRLCACGDD